MLKKLRLKQADQYEQAIATKFVGKMLVAFVNAEQHLRSIGSEQGNISHWDDFVIENSDGTFEHLQVKQQTTNFSDYGLLRGIISKGPNKGNPQGLSELDNAMKSLGEWVKNNRTTLSVFEQRRFSIFVPHGSVEIKQGLTIDHLARFCNTDINQYTDANGLTNLKTSNTAATNICSWLIEWCAFDNDGHVLAAVKKLKVFVTGNSQELKENSKLLLSTCFNDVDTVTAKIHQFLDYNSSYTNSITPRDLLKDLDSYRSNTTHSWTQYHQDSSVWKISGTHDLRIGQIEMPTETVASLWNPKKLGKIKLKSGRVPSDLGRAMVRLILHLKNQPTAYVVDSTAWLESAINLVGKTLGVSEDDCDDQNIRIMDESTITDSSQERTISGIDEADQEAMELNARMNEITWNNVATAVTVKIHALKSGELRTELDKRWLNWKADLEGKNDKQVTFLAAMLALNAEGNVFSELRMGIKTAKILSDGVFLLLVVAIGINEKDKGWEMIGSKVTISAKALSHWSGPSGLERRPRKITEEDGLDKLLGQEPNKLLVLAGTDMPIVEVTSDLISATKIPENNLASPHRPIVVTNNKIINRHITNGEILPLRNYIQQIITEASAGLQV